MDDNQPSSSGGVKDSGVLSRIENLIAQLIEDLVHGRFIEFKLIKTNLWDNIDLDADLKMLISKYSTSHPQWRHIIYCRKNSRQNFVIMLYVLTEAHKNIINGGISTCRELYYRNIALCQNQGKVNSAFCNTRSLLQTHAWSLGIASGKGLVAGPLQLFMQNGDVVDCSCFKNGGVLLPSDIMAIESLKTDAKCVLLVEKDTVFEILITEQVFTKLGFDLILVTGRGYPDLNTRKFINLLHYRYKLPIYGLFDGDPYGIEILLVYRYGSRSLAASPVEQRELVCPDIKWLGVHPSDIDLMDFQTTPLSHADNKKIASLLKREFIGEGMRKELQILLALQVKVETENLHSFAPNFLVSDYIKNKIKRNLYL